MDTKIDDTRLLLDLIEQSEQLFVKKLSNNDRDWAQRPGKNQAGPYISPQERDGGFFPALTVKDRQGPDIREAFFEITWPQSTKRRVAHLVNYTSKGQETHLTCVPKERFASLGPASWLVIARREINGERSWTALTIDSGDDAVDLLTDIFSLRPDFRTGIFLGDWLRDSAATQSRSFVELLLAALTTGKLPEFIATYKTLPPTLDLAAMARSAYLARMGLRNLNPFDLACPGDALLQISRVEEFALFRDLQQKASLARLIGLLHHEGPHLSSSDLIRAMAGHLWEIDALFLSAAQQRKTRAGSSFEHHVEAMLKDGNIPFDKQVILASKQRPDFVLPSIHHLRDPVHKSTSLVLSAKTTLKERWKQSTTETIGGSLFLATVDEGVSANVIAEMHVHGMVLVVPESLHSSKFTEYSRHSNVIDFKTFFEDELRRKRMPHWH